MTHATANTYDEVLYPSYPFPQTHPDRLATLATLFGMKPARVEACRVLEIGCGDGANLIPMALSLPESRFIGVDLAERPIARGQTMAEALGLCNVSLRQLDIMDLPSDLGQFDYVIAHGLYSWVPPAVRDKLLAICKAHLAPEGVAYVSYNTYPGSHLREMMREMMLFHVRDIQEPAERTAYARALVKFLAASQSGSDLYGTILTSLDKEVGRLHDGSLFHDHLADFNSPVYFHQFIDHARRHGLEYLAEADFFDMQHDTFSTDVSDTLQRIGEDDIVAREQYLDFLTGRRFRQTLLCHEDAAIDRKLSAERIMNLFVASPARPVSEEPVIDSTAVEMFQGNKAATMSTNHPLTKAAMLQLGKIWPWSLHFDDLIGASRAQLSPNLARHNGDIGRDDALRLGEFLLKAYAANLIELHAQPPRFVLEPGKRPTASRLARLQLESDTTVTTLRHTSVQVLDPVGRHLLMLLDGSRDRKGLLAELGRLVESRTILAEELEQNLINIARLALLVA
jgi:methyltransferase-like protein/2-polyprenyl-3-methyl-5-hydroxy-6-metoxy-1,4-benzoquinol methylase